MEKRGEFFDFDPFTGLEEYVEMDSDGMIHIHTYQDVEPILDHCKALANEGLPDGNFRKEGWLYAIIPTVVQLELLKKGIDLKNQNDLPKVVDEINQNYPLLKTTHRHHALR